MDEHLEYQLRNNYLTFEEFWFAQAEWSQATFGTDQERGAEGPLKHLAKEVLVELLGIDKPFVDTMIHEKCTPYGKADIMEFADCLFLVFDSCRRAGFSCEQLRIAVNEKLKINKARKWGQASATEAVEHIRE